MPQEFAGRVDITNSAVEPKVRISLSGDSGTAQFSGDGDQDPSTIVTNRRVAIGVREGAKRPSGPRAPGGPLVPGLGEPIPTGPSDTVGQDGAASAVPRVLLSIGDKTLAGGLFIVDASGQQSFELNGATASLKVGAEGNTGDVIIVDTKGEARIRLNGTTGDIELMGADCAEEFDLDQGVTAPDPGTVMTIGEAGLRPCGAAYDRRVAGVVSGAGPYRPGILLDKVEGKCERRPLALTGKVYCRVDATFAPIEIGDMLTTSPTLGCAMKATDPVRAFGAVIGKALQRLPSGQGFIEVLAALQ